MYEYEYPRPALSVDMMIVDTEQTPLKVLLIQRLHDPFKDQWALPGGFMEIDETLEQAAIRELKEETSLTIESVEQIGAFSTVDRDPRTRVITCGFLAIRPRGQEAMAADDAKQAEWFSLEELPDLAFDHHEILAQGLALLNSK
jgi:8-oxo-dGTP diphosphatase